MEMAHCGHAAGQDKDVTALGTAVPPQSPELAALSRAVPSPPEHKPTPARQTPAPGRGLSPAAWGGFCCSQGTAAGAHSPQRVMELLTSAAPELHRCLCQQKRRRSPQPRADEQGKPLAPHNQDPQGPRGDTSLITNQGPNPDSGRVRKVGSSRGSRPRDRRSKERENKAASRLKRDT